MARLFIETAFLCILFSCFGLLSRCTVLKVAVSQAYGHNNASCLISGFLHPCFSLQYALNNWNILNATTLSITVLDSKYLLEDQVSIAQPEQTRSVIISGWEKPSIIQCSASNAVINIGSQFVPEFGYARNVHVRDLTFQNCGPNLAAVILVWAAINISFESCTFRDNKNAGLNAFDSSITIKSCVFLNNTGNVRNESAIFFPGLTSSSGALSVMFTEGVNLSVTIQNSTFAQNSALVNSSEFHVAPSSNATDFYSGGGGLIVAFVNGAKFCSVYITNCNFKNNSATYGGGIYLIGSGLSSNNRIEFDGGSFVYNFGSQAGGAISTSWWDCARKMDVVLKNLVVKHNWSRRGAGLNSFFMSYVGKPKNSMLRLEHVQFLCNYGYGSRAIRFTTALPLDVQMSTIPEIVSCTISNHVHLDSTPTFTSPLTSQRVDVIFKGHNIFQNNVGVGAAHMENNIIYISGRLEFFHNTGFKGGAMELISSQIILHPGSELVFKENHAFGLGGAMTVKTFMAGEIIHQYNTDCFLTYINRHLPPSQWNTTVIFINNTAQLKGAAIMVSSLKSCLWTEEYPHHSYSKALRWNNKFVFQDNCLCCSNNKPLCGPVYDIATDTATFRADIGNSSLVELSPGENVTLDVKGVDELNHSVYTITSLSHPGILLMENTMYVLSPLTNSNFPFMYSLASKQKYLELTDKVDNETITVVDVFSSLKNEFSFKVRPVPCWPGFVFQDERCVCDKSREGISRCSGGHDVFLVEGYWAGLINGELVTYFCPSKYCGCVKSEDLPGCKYDQRNPDLQCAPGRQGTLCGQCKPGLSVGLRGFQCLKCEGSGWIFAVVVLVVITLCIVVIWLNVGISNDLRGPLFVFQMLPYLFDPNGDVERVVLFMADMFNFGGPLVYLFRTCVFKGMNNLYEIALGYLMPCVTLGVFVVFYILSANYLIRLKFRENSPLQAFWLIVLFMYTYLVQTTFLIQHCLKLGKKYVFFYDGNIECYRGSHLGMMVFSILVLIFLIIPPPIIVILLTRGIWKVDPQYVGTLTNGLRDGCYWWWAVDLSRRVLVVVTYVFIPDWNSKQMWMVLVCVFILALHSNMQPYKSKCTNTTETIYLALLCTLAALQFLDDTNVRSTISGVLLTLMTCHAFLLTMYKCYKFVKKRMGSSNCRQCKGRYGSTDETRVDPEVQEKKDTFDTIFSNSNEGTTGDRDSLY